MRSKRMKAKDLCPACQLKEKTVKNFRLEDFCAHCQSTYKHKTYIALKNKRNGKRSYTKRAVGRVRSRDIFDEDTTTAYELVIEQLTIRKKAIRNKYEQANKNIDAEINRLKKISK